MATVTQYETLDGKIPFEAWFSSLDAKAALKVRVAVAQMEAGNFGDHKSVGGGVWERRINFEKGYRIYFAKIGNDLILLFCGGVKSRQQADIDKAKDYLSEFKKRRQIEKKVKKKEEREQQKKDAQASQRQKAKRRKK